MVISVETLVFGALLFGFAGWGLYYREHRKSRDYATDLAQVIHDHPDATDSLRRSLQWQEINERVNDD